MFAAALPHSRPKLSGAVVATRRTTNPLFLASPSSLNLVSFSRVLRKSDGLVSSRSCSSKRGAHDLFEDFSVLLPDTPWDAKNTWTTFAAYFFILHIPLSFGGLSIVAQVLHQSTLDPLTTVASTALLQTTEFLGALALLHFTVKPQHAISSFFVEKLFTEQRSLVKASIIGAGLLIALVLLTSALADEFIVSRDVTSPVLKEILSDSSQSKAVCFVLYCFIAPALEETIYRGYLLTSLASKMKWWNAVIISSCVFSAAHFSVENSLQLFIIGCILGSVYCWTGNLASSIVIHSVYNAIILQSTIMS
ncbi:uncharacterized protein LOC109707930 isoform X1 [Ananas comosus]|uniref:Uncharacterized protein LOC109707930 isoform X1 n=1 Tax=Ananas comosus TaxID=4615 RepID=A0A6P5EN51_ANACO|nr:uncharacterized protein LOC109707930 isoform X1 [Ananas comosus]